MKRDGVNSGDIWMNNFSSLRSCKKKLVLGSLTVVEFTEVQTRPLNTFPLEYPGTEGTEEISRRDKVKSVGWRVGVVL